MYERSASRIRGVLEVRGKGSCECEFIRHLAPLTVGSIIRALPLEGRVVISEAYVGIITNLLIGAEKQREEFKVGDIGFITNNSILCIFVKDTKMRGVNPVGRVLANIDIMNKVSVGDVIVVRVLSN